MGCDVSSASRDSVTPHPVGQETYWVQDSQSTSFKLRGELVIPAKDAHQIDEIVTRPISTDVRLSRAQAPAEGYLAIEARIWNLDGCREGTVAETPEDAPLASFLHHEAPILQRPQAPPQQPAQRSAVNLPDCVGDPRGPDPGEFHACRAS
ncbi:MAG TPA: hypothetical protein VMW38_03340 [Terriglobia bacterium]|nr:hypothetical protein [Terriglobia bacterium]